MLGMIAPHLLVAAALVLSLTLFVQLKRELRRRARQWDREQETILEAHKELRSMIEDLRSRPATALRSKPVVVPAVNHLHRRSQVLRLSRLGEPAEAIAAALEMPRNEVDLVLKLSGGQQASAAAQ